MLGLNCRGDLPLMRRLTALRPNRDTLLPNRGLLPQISQTADTETPISYVIAGDGRATKRRVVARSEAMFGESRRLCRHEETVRILREAVRRSERMHGTSARDPVLHQFHGRPRGIDPVRTRATPTPARLATNRVNG